MRKLMIVAFAAMLVAPAFAALTANVPLSGSVTSFSEVSYSGSGLNFGALNPNDNGSLATAVSKTTVDGELLGSANFSAAVTAALAAAPAVPGGWHLTVTSPVGGSPVVDQDDKHLALTVSAWVDWTADVATAPVLPDVVVTIAGS